MAKIAYLFPGQGSQAVGMGLDLCNAYPVARRTFEQADEILTSVWGDEAPAGKSLSSLCFEGPEETLTQTLYTQPALYTTSLATLRVLQQGGAVPPEAAAGHSVGEYAALAAAGVFDFDTGLRLVARRAREMHRASEQSTGAMAAVLGLDPGDVEQICAAASVQSGGIVTPANFNAPGQVVISGEPAAVEAASTLAKERGAKRVMPLKVSGAFHSPLMSSAAAAMEPVLSQSTFQQPSVPVVANLTADYVPTADVARLGLAAQIDHPVRWQQTIERLLGDGFDAFVEVGHGKVLGGMLKRMAPDALVLSTGTLDGLAEAIKLGNVSE